MSARQRRTRDTSRRLKVAQEKALRRRARGANARPAAAATVVALTMAGAGVSTAATVTSSRAEIVRSGASSDTSAACEVLDTLGSAPGDLTAFGGRLYFHANDGRHGQELWTSDGTKAGTVLVEDIHPGRPGASPGPPTRFRGRLFFTARDGQHGRELWRSDGTAAGTRLVKDLGRGGPGEGPEDLTRSGGRLFFTDDRTGGRELWRSNGTKAGTVKVKLFDPEIDDYYTYSSDLTNVGGRLFFVAGTGIHNDGNELWKSDGTSAGTRAVKVFKNSADADIGGLTEADGRLFFTANDGQHGDEVWTSDGTRTGTVMVKEVTPGGYDDYFDAPIPMTEFNGRLFFTAYDGSQHGLWRSDGTSAGTKSVKELGYSDVVPPLVEVRDRLFFAAGYGGYGYANELWMSDGTTGGTRVVKELAPEGEGTVGNLTEVDGRLFFTVDDGIRGHELWTSDGTRAGTVLVKDIQRAGRRRGGPASLTDVGGRLFFTADDGVHGRELWTSDGTRAGTVQVKDINLAVGFTLARKSEADARNGTRRVEVQVDAAGQLVVAPARDRLIKTTSADMDAAGRTRVTLQPTAKGFKKLERALREAKRDGKEVGKVRVKVRFTYTSCAGGTSSQTHRYTLKLR